MNWYLIEYYTKDGDIRFVWVHTTSSERALERAKAETRDWGEKIQIGDHACPFTLYETQATVLAYRNGQQ